MLTFKSLLHRSFFILFFFLSYNMLLHRSHRYFLVYTICIFLLVNTVFLNNVIQPLRDITKFGDQSRENQLNITKKYRFVFNQKQSQ